MRPQTSLGITDFPRQRQADEFLVSGSLFLSKFYFLQVCSTYHKCTYLKIVIKENISYIETPLELNIPRCPVCYQLA